MQKDSELFEQFSGDKSDEVGAPYWVSRPELPLGPIIAGIIGILLVLIVLVDIIFYKTKNRGVFKNICKRIKNYFYRSHLSVMQKSEETSK